jgi:hypothetical protein
MSEYIVEFISRGRYVKVTAVDPVTGREAVIVGDAKARREELTAAAVQKLKFLLNKK